MKGPIYKYCPVEKNCLKWVQVYLKDCVCSRRDEVSLTLGLMSVVSWGVAEVPQILTNFLEKSTEGVSLLFLMTWVIGDGFNVAGCYMEPATSVGSVCSLSLPSMMKLPTQFYMALLYTITTVILVSQTIYYDYIRRWLHPKPVARYPEARKADMEAQKPLTIPEGTETAPSTTIRVPSSSRDLYFMSARSLASSYTPTPGSYSLVGSHGGSESGSYLVGPNSLSALHAGPARGGSGHKSSGSGMMRLAASSGTLVVGFMAHSGGGSLLQRSLGEEISPLGEVFGWIMAAIYMGGRVPQIWLNMQRGTVEGLNPLMFMFALVGNLTYVGSILVRSLEWAQLKPNLPWLVDAGVCVLLDCFILCQFGYYYAKQSRENATTEQDDKRGEYKPLQ